MSQEPRFTWKEIALKLRVPFRISYSVDEVRTAHWVRLFEDRGWGEGTIPSYYHISQESMTAYWHQAAEKSEALPQAVADVPAWLPAGGPAPARCAVEMALLDYLGHALDQPLYQLLGLAEPKSHHTSYTIAIDTPQRMAEMAASVLDYPVIKLKLGGEDDEACVAAVRRARPDARLRVDANAAWDLTQAIALAKRFEQYNLEMIEQPLPRDQIAAMGEVQAATPIPIVADESVQTLEDVRALGQAGVGGINIKLMKVGGMLKALEMIRLAQGYDMQIMLGCMIETSLGVTAMAHLSALASWIDLDAPLLVSNDPFEGIEYDRHLAIRVPRRAGIGARIRNI